MIVISFLIDVSFAFLFFYSFLSKVNSPYLQSEIYSYVKLPYRLLSLSAILLLFMELFIAISFAANWIPVYKEISVMAVLLVFMVLSMNKQKKGNGSCACFGNLTILNKFPLFRNSLFLMLLFIKLLLPQRMPSLHELIIVSTAVIAFSISLTASIDYRRLRNFGEIQR